MKTKQLFAALFVSLIVLASYGQNDIQKIKEKAKKEEEKREKVLNKLVTQAERHKPFRIRTGLGNEQFADIDTGFLDASSSYLLAMDIPTFTVYDQLYIGISGFTSVSFVDNENVDLDTFVVYGANANLNYSFKIVDGLYIVPMIGYGYVGVSDTEFVFDPDADFDNENQDVAFGNPFGFENDETGKAYFNYGVFLDFSFKLSAKGFGVTAGYDYFSGFTFGLKL